MKTTSYQKELEAYCAIKDYDIEIDMFRVGNLEMVCKSTLESLQAGSKPNKGIPSCVSIKAKQ